MWDPFKYSKFEFSIVDALRIKDYDLIFF
jgi:hypothetical protein